MSKRVATLIFAVAMRLYFLILSVVLPIVGHARFNTVGLNHPRRAVIAIESRQVETLIASDSVCVDQPFESSNASVINLMDSIVESVDDDAPPVLTEAELLEMRRILLSRRFLFHPPLKGRPVITSRFGYRSNPFSKRGREFHCGIDLAAPRGSTVYAMLPGIVQRKGYDARAGNFLTLRSGQFTLTYCHLESIPTIPIDTHVLPGQAVALSGSTGRSTGPHLHITLKRNGRVIDPAVLLCHICSLL